MDATELEERLATARAQLRLLTPKQLEAHIAQRKTELANTLKQLNNQLIDLALIDVPIDLKVTTRGITRRKHVAKTAVEMSPVPSFIQVDDLTNIPRGND